MTGKIPGLRKVETNTPLTSTAHRSKGFNMGLVAVLEKEGDIKVYAEHPAHLKYV
jgi:Stress responsive A/B Barrel Domain